MLQAAIKIVLLTTFFAGLPTHANEESGTILQNREWLMANPPEGYAAMVKQLTSDDQIERSLGLLALEEILPNNHWFMFVEKLLAMVKLGASAEIRQEIFWFRRERWATLSTLQEIEEALKTEQDPEVRLQAIDSAYTIWSDNLIRYPIDPEVQQPESYIAIVELGMRDQYDRVREVGYNLFRSIESKLNLETLERFLVFPEVKGRIEQKIARLRREAAGDCSAVLSHPE